MLAQAEIHHLIVNPLHVIPHPGDGHITGIGEVIASLPSAKQIDIPVAQGTNPAQLRAELRRYQEFQAEPAIWPGQRFVLIGPVCALILQLLHLVLVVVRKTKIPEFLGHIVVIDKSTDIPAHVLEQTDLEAANVFVIMGHIHLVIDQSVFAVVLLPPRLIVQCFIISGNSHLEHIQNRLLIAQFIRHGGRKRHIGIGEH